MDERRTVPVGAKPARGRSARSGVQGREQDTPSGLRPATHRLILTIMALAFTIRIARYPTPSIWLLARQYDPAVMYTASASFMHGQLPYRDFIFLHPPGVLIGMAPFTVLGRWLGDAQGLALATLAVILLGAINTGLVCLLLRRFGALSVLAGGGLYATWGALVLPEQLALLEPFLVTALLLAFFWARIPRRRSHFLAGLVLGIATMVKVWAAVDLVLVAVMMLARYRSIGLRWFIGGAAVGGSLIGLPFFLAAPAAMWEMVVTVQVGRPPGEVHLVDRAALFGPFPTWDLPAYRAMVVVGLVFLVAFAVLVVVLNLLRALTGRQPAERMWWALAALAHAALLMAAPTFYDHYSMFAAAPLVLVFGSVVGRLPHRDDPKVALRYTAAVGGLIGFLALGSLVASFARVADTPAFPRRDRIEIAKWADAHGCTWMSIEDRILFDQVNSTLAKGCPLTVDWYGRNLVAMSRGTGPGAAYVNAGWETILQADAVVFYLDEAAWPLTDEQQFAFLAAFDQERLVGRRSLWVAER